MLLLSSTLLIRKTGSEVGWGSRLKSGKGNQKEGWETERRVVEQTRLKYLLHVKAGWHVPWLEGLEVKKWSNSKRGDFCHQIMNDYN